jgi:hypothetical protein
MSPNRLAAETSPYLRQHADNPVDWYPWGDEAFAAARTRDVPILLSVGYSACHWCHVMAHESFEDAAAAGVMNDLFVNIKVDREERPDVDAIYMDATQAMTGHGGWPMTVFLTPDREPFYCGTYFPPEPRHGMPSFLEVCRAIADAWANRRDELTEQAAKLTEAVSRSVPAGGPDAGLPGAEALDQAYSVLRQQHDDEWGGFGRAPKFPQTMSLELLLRAHAHNHAAVTLAMVTTSLDAMASGGMYDHLGGGFARYSVDGQWLVPHFEKMLYDQALLARVYLHAWQVTGLPRYRQVLEETIGYVLRDLRHPGGGFYSAEDADSEGEEGLFYTWTPAEITAGLGRDGDGGGAAAEAMAWYGVTEPGSFEGRSILNRIAHRGELERPPAIEAARARLFEARAARVRPGLDDKILTEWNGLMLSTLAEAAAATGRDDWRAAAVANAEFLLGAMRGDDGRWRRSWQADGGARHLAYAADHAALVDAFTRLAEATGQARWISAAAETADALLDLFWDSEDGCLFTTGTDAEPLLTRPKDLLDNATPSANSMAAVALLRLGAITGHERHRERAEAILRRVGGLAAEHPTAFANLLAAVDMHTSGITEVVVTGERPDLVAAAHGRYLPNAVVVWGERFASPLWEGRTEEGAAGRAYVCRDYVCRTPVTDVDALDAELSGV